MTGEQYVVLGIRFDVAQDSDQLTWTLVPGNENPVGEYGTGGGAVQLYQGESVALQVVGSGAIDGHDGHFTSFQVIECCLITRPKIVVAGPDRETRYAPPSPFLQSIGASYFFENDFDSSVADKGNRRTITQLWKRSLNIAHTNGSWELSLNLTVRILRGTHATEVRVFRFDPEVQVGNGTRPN